MAMAFGERWFETKVPDRLLRKWIAYRGTAIANGEIEAPLLCYADFSDYGQLLAYEDNWGTIFCTVFGDRDEVIASLHQLNIVREPTMHSRDISDEFLRVLKIEIAADFVRL